MWTSTNGSPILVGMNDEEIFVASEKIAFLKQADHYFVTLDGEIFELDFDHIQQLTEEMNEKGRLHTIPHNDKKNIHEKPPEPYKSFYSYEI